MRQRRVLRNVQLLLRGRARRARLTPAPGKDPGAARKEHPMTYFIASDFRTTAARLRAGDCFRIRGHEVRVTRVERAVNGTVKAHLVDAHHGLGKNTSLEYLNPRSWVELSGESAEAKRASRLSAGA